MKCQSQVPGRTSGGTSRTLVVLHISFVCAAVCLLLLARHFHHLYGRAHVVAGDVIHRAMPEPTSLPPRLPNPEAFYRRAWFAAYGVLMICIANALVAVIARRVISFASLAACCLILAVCVAETSVRY